jgi:hypothetical protein
MTVEIQLDWKGPFFPGKSSENELPPEHISGVYIWAVNTPRGRLLAYVGKAENIRHRWCVHMYWHLGGGYSLYEVDAMRKGEGLKKMYSSRRYETVFTDFIPNLVGLAALAKRNIESYELYWASVVGDRALRTATESAIYWAIAKQAGTNAAILMQNDRPTPGPDRCLSVRCASRWPDGIKIEGLADQIDFGAKE